MTTTEQTELNTTIGPIGPDQLSTDTQTELNTSAGGNPPSSLTAELERMAADIALLLAATAPLSLRQDCCSTPAPAR
jgi:hypothetical protein